MTPDKVAALVKRLQQIRDRDGPTRIRALCGEAADALESISTAAGMVNGHSYNAKCAANGCEVCQAEYDSRTL